MPHRRFLRTVPKGPASTDLPGRLGHRTSSRATSVGSSSYRHARPTPGLARRRHVRRLRLLTRAFSATGRTRWNGSPPCESRTSPSRPSPAPSSRVPPASDALLGGLPTPTSRDDDTFRASLRSTANTRTPHRRSTGSGRAPRARTPQGSLYGRRSTATGQHTGANVSPLKAPEEPYVRIDLSSLRTCPWISTPELQKLIRLGPR